MNGPPPTPEQQQWDALLGTSVGAGLWGLTTQAGVDPRVSNALLAGAAAVGQLEGGLVGIGQPGRVGGTSPNTFARVRTRAIDTAQGYEAQIRDSYGSTAFQQRQYTTVVNGQRVNGVADNVAVVNGLDSAIEAKYVDYWPTSLRNPGSPNGGRPWAVAEQRKMVSQAVGYGNAFDQVIYHTNSQELADHYGPLFESAGVDNFQFVITPLNQGD